MSEVSHNPQQMHEGPWRKINDYVTDERQLNERHIGPNYTEQLTARYGRDNWRFEKTAYETKNSEERLRAQNISKLASQGMANVLAGRGYALDDGTDISGKVTRYSQKPDLGDIVVSPDVDAPPYASNRIDK